MRDPDVSSPPSRIADRLKARVVRDVLPLAGLTSLNRLRRAQRARDRTVEELGRALADREREIHAYRDVVAENERSVQTYRDVVAERERSIQTYQGIVAEYERSMQTCRDVVAEHERSIQAYQGIVAENERSVQTYRDIVAERERSIQAYQGVVAEHERSIQAYQGIVAEHERSVQRYQAIVAEQAARLESFDNLDQVKRQIAAHSETAAEFAAVQSRSVEMIQARLDGIAQLTGDLGAKTYVNRGLDELGDGAAQFLNFANGDRGFAAQAGVWFDWPIRASFRAGAASIGDVNERIVEIPFAFGALSCLTPGSHILDFGATGSFLALSLACLGHEVIALDRRPYPLEHPRLKVVTEPIDGWSGPERTLDAVVCISASARIGRDQTDADGSSYPLDRGMLDRFRRWLRPEGLLVLSVPYGAAATDDGRQTYDAAYLEALLDGWLVLEQRFAVNSEPCQWTIADGKPTPAKRESAVRAVVLVRATPMQ